MSLYSTVYNACRFCWDIFTKIIFGFFTCMTPRMAVCLLYTLVATYQPFYSAQMTIVQWWGGGHLHTIPNLSVTKNKGGGALTWVGCSDSVICMVLQYIVINNSTILLPFKYDLMLSLHVLHLFYAICRQFYRL